VDVDLLAGNGFVAVAENEVFDHELDRRRLICGDLDLGLLIGCHDVNRIRPR
jgi:hypothetical protein